MVELELSDSSEVDGLLSPEEYKADVEEAVMFPYLPATPSDIRLWHRLGLDSTDNCSMTYWIQSLNRNGSKEEPKS